jgi:hypothetical protein
VGGEKLDIIQDDKKKENFETPNKNRRNPRKKLLTEIEPLQLAF